MISSRLFAGTIPFRNGRWISGKLVRQQQGANTAADLLTAITRAPKADVTYKAT